MPAPEKHVRVFVSSTFRDMHAERDHLVTVVFPELRERLERLGLDFFDVDLRWGVPQTGVDGERANSWAYCKQWIDRVEPFFVCILGQRYGWTPHPDEIHDEADRAAFAGMSITEMEVRHAVLSGRVRRRSFFYFRNTPVPTSAPAGIYQEFVDVADTDRLNALKKQITEGSGRPVRPYDCHWTGDRFDALDAFGQAVLEDLWSGVLRDERYVSKDAWRKAIGHEPDGDPLYADESQPVPREVWEKIVEHARPAPRDPIDAEAEAMAAFAASRLRGFQGRQRELDELAHFVGDLPPDASRLCVVRAVPGQGKSALLARFTEDLTQSAVLVSHFVGATEHSADPRLLVARIVKELDRNGIPRPEGEEDKEDLESLAKRLAARLENYAGERRIILVIDAVNQLTSGHDLAWLPQSLGPNVRVILSCVDDAVRSSGFSPSSSQIRPEGRTPNDSPEARVLAALASRRPEPRWVDLRPLDEADVREIVKGYLLEYCKELDLEPIETICQMEQARNPLYLLVMLNELRTLGGNDMNRIVPRLIAEMKRRHPDAVSLFDWVLERLEVFGREPVRLWCSYLASGRAGMASRELSDLLVRKLGPDATRTALLIERGLRRYLQRRGPQLDFFHSQLRQAVAQRYLQQEPDRVQAHTDIAAYFETRWRDKDLHALDELPYQQARGHLGEAIGKTLTDFHFLQAKTSAFGTQPVIDDYDLALAPRFIPSSEPLEALRLIQGAIRLSAHLVARDTRQLPSQLLGRLLGEEAPELRAMLEQAVGWKGAPWLRPLNATLGAPGGPLLRTLEGHTNGVTAVSVFAQGRRAISGSFDHSLKVWNLETGQEVLTLLGHMNSITAVSVFADGRRAISASEDKTLKVWDLESGGEVRTLEGHTDEVTDVSVFGDGRLAISASDDKTLKVWNLESGREVRTLRGHNKSVGAVSVFAEGRRAISASCDNTLVVWDLESGRAVRTLEGHRSVVDAVSVFGDGRRAISAGNTTLKVWDLESGRLVRTLEGNTAAITAVSVFWDGRRAISASTDKTLKVWDLESGRELRTLEGHTSRVLAVSVFAGGRRAISASEDNTLKVWDVESGRVLPPREGHRGAVTAVSVFANGRRAISASSDGTLKVWDLESAREVRTLVGHTRIVTAVSVFADGRRAISASGDKTLKVWDLESGREVRTLEGHTSGVLAVSVFAGGRRAITGACWPDKTLKVWDLESGREVRTIEGHTAGVMAVSVFADGRRAISASGYKTLKVWDLESGRELRTLEGHTEPVTAVSVFADGRQAISVSDDRTLKVWDLESGQEARTLEVHTDWVKVVSVFAEGRLAVSASWRNSLKVWDLESGRAVRTLEGHKAFVSAVPVFADGRRVISASWDMTLMVWDLESGAAVASFSGEDRMCACAVCPDDRTVVAGDASGRVHFLRLQGVEE